jgi:hypothetical protein
MKTSLLFLSLLILSVSCSSIGNSELEIPSVSSEFLPVQPLGGIPCTICSKVVGWLYGKISKYGCSILIKAEAAAACEFAGLGPEDPLADICAAAVIAGCGEILKLIEQHVQDPTKICQLTHIC